ncbi:MAG: hypothetical protein ACYDE0_01355 [Acidiferrobacterales bacterium]
MRTSQINRCAFCAQYHVNAAAGSGYPRQARSGFRLAGGGRILGTGANRIGVDRGTDVHDRAERLRGALCRTAGTVLRDRDHLSGSCGERDQFRESDRRCAAFRPTHTVGAILTWSFTTGASTSTLQYVDDEVSVRHCYADGAVTPTHLASESEFVARWHRQPIAGAV